MNKDELHEERFQKFKELRIAREKFSVLEKEHEEQLSNLEKEHEDLVERCARAEIFEDVPTVSEEEKV